MNYSLSGSGATVSVTVKVNSSSDSDQVESTLLETAKKVAGQFNLPASQEPQVTLTSDFTDPVLQFAVNVPVPTAFRPGSSFPQRYAKRSPSGTGRVNLSPRSAANGRAVAELTLCMQ